MRADIETLERFALIIYNLLRSDRDALIGVAGTKGEGKSVFLIQLLKAYCKVRGIEWDFNLMTWSRKELLKWIDGKPGSKPSPEGLKEGQLAQYNGIIADELFTMFYKRNWYDNGQIDGLATLNMCRDRHLLIAGNVPNFWDLDSAFITTIRFYVYIIKRGVAYVFQQENNPFGSDVWNIQENKKLFRKYKNPYKSANFLFEIHYPDLTAEEKAVYLEIRNNKRLEAIKENSREQIERYQSVKLKKDSWRRLALTFNKMLSKDKKLSQKEMSEITGESEATISYASNEVR